MVSDMLSILVSTINEIYFIISVSSFIVNGCNFIISGKVAFKNNEISLTLKSRTMNGFFIDNELSNINNGYISLTMKRMTLIMNAYSLTVSSFMKSAFKLPASL